MRKVNFFSWQKFKIKNSNPKPTWIHFRQKFDHEWLLLYAGPARKKTWKVVGLSENNFSLFAFLQYFRILRIFRHICNKIRKNFLLLIKGPWSSNLWKSRVQISHTTVPSRRISYWRMSWILMRSQKGRRGYILSQIHTHSWSSRYGRTESRARTLCLNIEYWRDFLPIPTGSGV